MWKISKTKCRLEINKFKILNDCFFELVTQSIQDYNNTYRKHSGYIPSILDFFDKENYIELRFQQITDVIIASTPMESILNNKESLKLLKHNYKEYHYTDGKNLLADFVNKMDATNGYNEDRDLPIFDYIFEAHKNYYETLYYYLIEANETNNNEEIYNDRNKAFNSIFKNDKAFKLCVKLMEELEITKNGDCILTPKKSGQLIGLIIAFKNRWELVLKKFLPDMELLNHFNKFLNTNYKKLNKDTKSFDFGYNTSKKEIEFTMSK